MATGQAPLCLNAFKLSKGLAVKALFESEPASFGLSVSVEGRCDLVQMSESRLLQRNVNAEYGILFKKTDDILTAAGIILEECHNVGDQSFIHLYTQLQNSDETPLFLEKVSLLVEGEYRGIRLYRDLTSRSTGPHPGRICFASCEHTARSSSEPVPSIL